jgi:hypothetical protein
MSSEEINDKIDEIVRKLNKKDGAVLRGEWKWIF